MALRVSVKCLFNPKGTSGMFKPLNPGLKADLAPKSMHPHNARPNSVSPFDHSQSVARELTAEFTLRYPEITKGVYGRRGQNRRSMLKYARYLSVKWSAYRWLMKQERRFVNKNNISSAVEQHGLTFHEFSAKSLMQGSRLQLQTLNTLAQREPLAFRSLCELARSDNLKSLNNPNIYRESVAKEKEARKYFQNYMLQTPIPMKRRLPDPTWRDIPFRQSRMSDKEFHPRHPIFLVDWKI
eukprot:TRINITY_DN9233_c0_g1_i1.p1 TRINITY_DN9233_c0_g1~~TRINITY_DN9233_c0_g1_i1.p1  ORF type:complete len:240 (+),score=11.34 TRINITY_DN9233_c0_g1_i1:73-792(+)